MKIKRSVLMNIHTLLAVFLLPVAIMFFVTGALYIWDVKGGEEKTNYTLNIEPSFSGELSEYVFITENKLEKLNLPPPTGNPKIKIKDGKTIFEWSGSAVEAKIETNPKQFTAKLEVKKASWYRHLVQLHKAKGGFFFKIYATILSIALLILLLTGFIMAWQMPKLRKLTVISTISGVLVFILLVISN